uniref:Uncharacterized protein n=1 Tax=Otus sunia TaxID=257818 RepID=A0A8C8E9W1_9STRI
SAPVVACAGSKQSLYAKSNILLRSRPLFFISSNFCEHHHVAKYLLLCGRGILKSLLSPLGRDAKLGKHKKLVVQPAIEHSVLTWAWLGLNIGTAPAHVPATVRDSSPLSAPSCQAVAEGQEVSPQPPLLQTKPPQFPQPLPIRPGLQTLHQLRCPSLDTLESFKGLFGVSTVVLNEKAPPVKWLLHAQTH